MPARKPKALPADASLVERVQATVDAFQIGPQHSALVGLALMLARTIDGMDDDVRGRMLGQTSGALLRTLDELRSSATLREAAERQRSWGSGGRYGTGWDGMAG
jgi:hypothetical protein